jgi:hypothetical protein
MMEVLNLSRQPRGGHVVTPSATGSLHVWERPLVGCRYLLSVRGGGAPKIVGGKRDRERSVIMVLRRGYLEEGSEMWKPTRLAARLAPPVLLDPTPLAEVVAAMAEWYGRALCFVEVKDGAVLAKECQRLGAAVQIREVLDQATSLFKQDLGWMTDDETGPATLNALVNAIRQTARLSPGGRQPLVPGAAASPESRGGMQIECEHALAELNTFADDDSETPAVKHDDDVRALATGIYNIESASLLHQHTRARQPPSDGWKIAQTFGGM